MTETFPYGKRYWYPHMMPKDVEIWERFIAKYPDLFTTVEYDVKVGSVPDFVKRESPDTVENQQALYQKKIDVVAYNDTSITIIELKPRAGASTIGQVQAYKILYAREFLSSRKLEMAIVTNEETADMRFLCDQAGVVLYVV